MTGTEWPLRTNQTSALNDNINKKYTVGSHAACGRYCIYEGVVMTLILDSAIFCGFVETTLTAQKT